MSDLKLRSPRSHKPLGSVSKTPKITWGYRRQPETFLKEGYRKVSVDDPKSSEDCRLLFAVVQTEALLAVEEYLHVLKYELMSDLKLCSPRPDKLLGSVAEKPAVRKVQSANLKKNRGKHIVYQRTNYGKFSIRYRGAQLGKSLPENLRNQKTFKNSIEIYIKYHIQ